MREPFSGNPWYLMNYAENGLEQVARGGKLNADFFLGGEGGGGLYTVSCWLV
jgi:hypothetical protein